MPTLEFTSHSAEETVAMGRELAQRLSAPVLVLLSGDLGSGKTTLTKGIISGLEAAREEDVTSPTFTLVHVFHTGATRSALSRGNVQESAARACRPQTAVYHVDLYRVEKFHDLETVGLEDAFADPAIVIIEWPERFALRNDWPQVAVRLEHVEGETRRITISGDAAPPAD